jgi:hydroxymethylglutaryl-CoA synthase
MAIVVAADIAVYAPGVARPTGGCGAVAMLIGPNAALAIERGVRGSYMDDVWDFYKPVPTVEWPIVDGNLSNMTYLTALDSCYDLYRKRFASKEKRQFSLDDAPFLCFHAPYNKLVQRSFSRLVYNDFYTNPSRPEFANLQKFSALKREDTYKNTFGAIALSINWLLFTHSITIEQRGG